MAGIASEFVAPFLHCTSGLSDVTALLSYSRHFAEIITRLLDRFNNNASYYSLTYGIA